MNDLVSIRPGVTFTRPAAESFARAEFDLGRRIDVNSTWRDPALQLVMFNAWSRYVASGYKPALKPNHSRALHPNLSAHCRGEGLDSDDWTKPGFIAFIARHGWIRTASNDPTERHHFEYQIDRDQYRGRLTPAGVSFTPIEQEPEQTKEDDMSIRYINAADRGDAMVGEFGYYPSASVEYAATERDVWGGGTVTTRQYDVLRQAALNRRNELVAQVAQSVTAALPASAAVDLSALAGLVVNGLRNAGIGSAGGVDTAAVVAALAPLLAAVPDRTAEELRQRLES